MKGFVIFKVEDLFLNFICSQISTTVHKNNSMNTWIHWKKMMNPTPFLRTNFSIPKRRSLLEL